MPVSLIGASFAIAAFPVLSASAAAGDRRAFGRVFATNLASIVVLTTGAAMGLWVVGETAIRVLLGGGAFDEDDVTRTAGILAIFALSVPLESLTHLLSRAIYATHNTILPTIASVAGFVVIVVVGQSLSPTIGLAAIPAAFVVGMGVKVAILGLALVPRMAAIGRPAGSARPIGSPVQRRFGQAVLAVALVTLMFGTVYAAGQSLAGSIAGRRAGHHAVGASAAAGRESVPPLPSDIASLAPDDSASPSAIPVAAGGGSPSPGGSGAPSAAPTPTPKPKPFSMDLYQKGDYVGELKDMWCLPAAMQTSMNIMDKGADTTWATQSKLASFARSLDPAPDGAAEPEGWAEGLDPARLRQLRRPGPAVDPVGDPGRRPPGPAHEPARRPDGLEGRPLVGHVGLQRDRRSRPDQRLHRDRGPDRGRLVSALLDDLGLLPGARLGVQGERPVAGLPAVEAPRSGPTRARTATS